MISGPEFAPNSAGLRACSEQKRAVPRRRRQLPAKDCGGRLRVSASGQKPVRMPGPAATGAGPAAASSAASGCSSTGSWTGQVQLPRLFRTLCQRWSRFIRSGHPPASGSAFETHPAGHLVRLEPPLRRLLPSSPPPLNPAANSSASDLRGQTSSRSCGGKAAAGIGRLIALRLGCRLRRLPRKRRIPGSSGCIPNGGSPAAPRAAASRSCKLCQRVLCGLGPA